MSAAPKIGPVSGANECTPKDPVQTFACSHIILLHADMRLELQSPHPKQWKRSKLTDQIMLLHKEYVCGQNVDVIGGFHHVRLAGKA